MTNLAWKLGDFISEFDSFLLKEMQSCEVALFNFFLTPNFSPWVMRKSLGEQRLSHLPLETYRICNVPLISLLVTGIMLRTHIIIKIYHSFTFIFANFNCLDLNFSRHFQSIVNVSKSSKKDNRIATLDTHAVFITSSGQQENVCNSSRWVRTSEVRLITMSCATKRRKYLHAVEITTDDKRRCNFCHLGVETYPEDVTKSGKFYLFKDIHVHFFCVLFDKKTLQTSTADSGLFGFTYSKVKEALRRSNKKECGYCGRKGALIKCAAAEGKKCGMRFHFPCGINNGALFRFEGDYIAFCSRHKPDVNLGRESGALPDVTCLAGCLEQIRGDEDYLIGPCCQKKLHLRCLQVINNVRTLSP